MVAIWNIVGFCFAVLVILLILFIGESAISAKIDELSKRKEFKKLEKESLKQLEKNINEELEKLFSNEDE